MTIRGIRCGIAQCDWSEALSGLPTPLFVALVYSRYWKHLVKGHGLNPNLQEPAGLKGATLHLDQSNGARITIKMTAKGN